MSVNRRKGISTWLLGFFGLLAVLNVINSLIQLNLNGYGSTSNLRIFDLSLANISTEAYFWISIIATVMLFTAAWFSVYHGLPTDPRVLERLTKMEENLTLNSNMIENTQIGFFRKLEENEKANDETFRKLNINLQDMRKENSESLLKQEKTLTNVEEHSKKNTETIGKQTVELSNLKKTIEKMGKIEGKTPKASLTSKTKLEKLRSITPRLAAKLREMKITSVSELLAADPATVAEKTSELVETVSNMQAKAQLLMVPGIDEKHAELLVTIGVTSRRELANQDPVQLYRGVAGVAKTYADRGRMSARKIPTIEDVSSWIRQARL